MDDDDNDDNDDSAAESRVESRLRIHFLPPLMPLKTNWRLLLLLYVAADNAEQVAGRGKQRRRRRVRA